MSGPSTPPQPGSKPSTLSSAGRKRPLSIVDNVAELVNGIDVDHEDNDGLKAAILEMKQLLDKQEHLTPSKKTKAEKNITPASTLNDREFVVAVLGLDFREEDIWEGPVGPDVRLSDDCASLLKRMRLATFWRRESSETMTRPLIDIILFDRLEAHQEELAARGLCVRGETPINAEMQEGHGIITGNVDYAFGYDPRTPYTPKSFESVFVIVEAEKAPSAPGEDAQAQVIAYMVGTQQRRTQLKEPKRIVDTTYGIITNGIWWQFLRLDGTKLRMSLPFTMHVAANRPRIYQFVDAIVRASIEISPHTTPRRQFPSTNARWQKDVESPILRGPDPTTEEWLETPAKECLVDDEVDSDDLKEVEYFDIEHPGGSVLCGYSHVGHGPDTREDPKAA